MKTLMTALILTWVAPAALAGDDPYGRFLMCDTTAYQPGTRQYRQQRFFAAAMDTARLTFTISIEGREVTGSGYANDTFGIFQLRDRSSGETRTWSGAMRSAHQIERQSFHLSLGDLSIACQYGIPVGP